MNREQENLRNLTKELCLIPGLSGYESNVRKFIERRLKKLKLKFETDILGNLVCTLKGNPAYPSVMLFAHMDQIGFIVKKIEDNGFIKVERVGGVPEKTLPSTDVVVINDKDQEINGVIGNKSHHVTLPKDRYVVPSYRDLYLDFGFESYKETISHGVNVGSPITYKPSFNDIGKYRMVGTSIDDRAGCAIIIDMIKDLLKVKNIPTVHLVFSVQEEFNLRGVVPLARKLNPDIAIQLDISISADTNETFDTGNIKLNNGPCMSMYSFHGRGTLNGLIPHPQLVTLINDTAKKNKINLQRIATSGLLTETSYVQLLGKGVACIDMGFPVRYSHSPNEICDIRDLTQLKKLLILSLKNTKNNLHLKRN